MYRSALSARNWIATRDTAYGEYGGAKPLLAGNSHAHILIALWLLHR